MINKSDRALAQTASKWMHLCVGHIFQVDGREVRLEAIHDSGVVELRDLRTLGLLQIRDAKSGTLAAPTIHWMRDAYADGLLYSVGKPESNRDRQGRFALLDPNAAVDRDKKSVWRHNLAWRALADGVKKTDAGAEAWLADNFGKHEGDFTFPKPSGCAVRRWMSKLEKRGRRVASLVATAGRHRGQSPLDPVIAQHLEAAALLYWATRKLKMVDAYGWLKKKVEELNGSLAEGRAPYVLPSFEALRKRIGNLECRETYSAKYGATAAANRFKGSGEALVVDHLLEVVLMDATTLEQVIVFDDDWALPACKVRITALMCALSRAIIGYSVYAGPNRTETSFEAIISCMHPPEVSAEMLAEYPDLKWIFGKPAAILPDNEKALMSPAALPGLNEAGIGLLLPPIEMPTAKAALERFFRTLKEQLAILPGTVIDPKRLKELDYDALGSAVLTLAQLRSIVDQVIAAYNVSPSKGLDNWSPLQMFMRKSKQRATDAFEDIGVVRRALGRTATALLTTDGIEFDSIRYRDARTVEMLLDVLANTMPIRSQRKDGTATVEVKIRVNDGNLDVIEVYNPVANEYVPLPSTQPEYTHRLSRWEHHEFKRQAKKRREPFSSQDDRLRSGQITLKMIDEMVPGLPFQRRRDFAALYQSFHAKDQDAASPIFDGEVSFANQVVVDTMREDDGLPAPLPAREKKIKGKYLPPERADGYGLPVREDELGDFSWDSVDVEGPSGLGIDHDAEERDAGGDDDSGLGDDA